MYRARDRIDNEEWVARLTRAADGLDLGSEARSNAVDLFLSNAPAKERSKPAVAAASLYAGALIAGEERSQGSVASAMDVTRLSVQNRWKSVLESSGFRSPEW